MNYSDLNQTQVGIVIMKYHSKFLGLFFGSAMLAGITAGAASAETTTSRNLVCSGVDLKAAAREPGNPQSWFYQLSGICNLIDHTVTETTTSTTSRNDVVMAGFATVNARWNDATGKASETVEFEGEMHGRINSSFQCNSNPFVSSQSCVVTGYEVSDDSLGYVAAYITQLRTPMTGGLVNAGTAAQLAQSNSAPPPPPPPPPPAASSQVQILTGVMFRDPIVLEGEELAGEVSGQGQASPQNMAGFGTGWSNNAHLFWAPQGVGSLLTIPLESSGPSGYTVTVSLTKAPDFGQVRAYVRYGLQGGGSGDTTPVDFDAFSPNVDSPTPVSITVPQTDGDMKLVIITMGKNGASSGLYSGIDRIMIQRAP